MTLLAIDCGNTNTGFAIFDEETCLGSWRTSTNPARTADEYAVWLSQLLALNGLEHSRISEVIIANVVPETAFNLHRLCTRHFHVTPMIVGSDDVDTGIEVRIDTPREVGADRVVNAVGARDRYGTPLIIIDFGTATTFDIVDHDGAYAGGVIAPGINLSLEALYRSAAQLPRITVTPPAAGPSPGTPARVIGHSTREAMQAGIFWGYVGLIEGIVSRIIAEFGSGMTVVATGGLAPVFARHLAVVDHVDSDITVRGLVLIHRRNRLRADGDAS